MSGMSLQQIHEKLRLATFRIKIPEENGIYWGTGFFITPDGLALTAYHNLPKSVESQGEGKVDVYYRDPTESLSLMWRADLSNKDIDIAVLQLSDPQSRSIDYLTPAYLNLGLKQSQRYQFWAGRPVCVYGFPCEEGVEGERRVDGQIDAGQPLAWVDEYDEDNNLIRSERLRILGRDEMLPGISGGPVFDRESGFVIGVDGAALRPMRYRAWILASELASLVEQWPADLKSLVQPLTIGTSALERKPEGGGKTMKVFLSSPPDVQSDAVFRTINEAAESLKFQPVRVVFTLIIEGIEQNIRDSAVVIADVTGFNSSVLLVVGQAQVLGIPLVMISRDPPTDAASKVRGLRILNYKVQEMNALRDDIRRALSEAIILRSMLVPMSLGSPTKDSRFVVVASPLSYRRARSQSAGHKWLLRMFSDYVGVRGILQAFGLLYGFETLPDILDPEDFDDPVAKEPMHMYCIASPKANRWTGLLLAELGERWVPRLEFKADPMSRDLRNINVSLYDDNVLLAPNGWEVNSEGDRWARDFGLIVRAPNPYHPELMVTIMAGRSSLGTEAACRACTDAGILGQIQVQLMAQGVDLERHEQPFWALVSMERSQTDKLKQPKLDSLRLRRVQPLEPRQRTDTTG